MTDEDYWKAFGKRVAARRTSLDLSQAELAPRIGRSESWVSQVERGVYPVERMSSLQALADALRMPLSELRGETVGSDASRNPNLAGLRLVLAGHPALKFVYAPAQTLDELDFVVDELPNRVQEAWEREHAGAYVELDQVLSELIVDLEHAVRVVQVNDEHRASMYLLLARSYQIAAATLARRDEADASWVAADRAITNAERSGDTQHVLAAHFRLAHAYMRLSQLDQAELVAKTARDALEAMTRRADASPEDLSLFGAMTLVLALIRARETDRAGAKHYIVEARQIAARIGSDRNDFNTEFGPTNVEVHALTIAVDTGDAGEALDIAASLNRSHLSPERQARCLLDVARAHAQLRHIGDAVASLCAAEELAPDLIRGHRLTRETVSVLTSLAGRRQPRELVDLAKRVAADV